MPGGAGFLPSTVGLIKFELVFMVPWLNQKVFG